jgi:hypothetical protein
MTQRHRATLTPTSRAIKSEASVCKQSKGVCIVAFASFVDVIVGEQEVSIGVLYACNTMQLRHLCVCLRHNCIYMCSLYVVTATATVALSTDDTGLVLIVFRLL